MCVCVSTINLTAKVSNLSGCCRSTDYVSTEHDIAYTVKITLPTLHPFVSFTAITVSSVTKLQNRRLSESPYFIHFPTVFPCDSSHEFDSYVVYCLYVFYDFDNCMGLMVQKKKEFGYVYIVKICLKDM